MNRLMLNWLLPPTVCCITSTRRHVMDEVAWNSHGGSSRFARQSLHSLVVYGSDDPVVVPESPTLPTPTDVPVPEPFDVPVPEPMDVPPPEPTDVPPPKPRPVP
jgi:hypothetical protein